MLRVVPRQRRCIVRSSLWKPAAPPIVETNETEFARKLFFKKNLFSTFFLTGPLRCSAQSPEKMLYNTIYYTASDKA